MKTALYIAGALKAFEYTVDSINRFLIEPNNCDVYVCVWDTLGVDLNHLKVKKESVKLKNREVTSDDILKFKNVKDFKILKFDNSYYKFLDSVSIPDKVVNKHNIHYYSTIPLSYMTLNCHKMNLQSYDRILKIRPDLKFFNTFDVKQIMKSSNCLYSSSYNINPTRQVSDKFVGGSPLYMNHYCDFYNWLNKHWIKQIEVGERLLRHHMKCVKMNVSYFQSNIKIVRENLH